MKKLTRSRIILPVLVLLICLIFSYISWDIADTNRKNELRLYFEFRSRDVNDRIKHRVSEYQAILRSMRGLFNATANVDRTEFQTFINSLSLEKNSPGIQGVGFSVIIPSEQIKKHITTIRNEGFTKYKIWPEGNRETYTSIIYLEPFRDINLRAFGYDMYSEPVRRKAMATSRDLNKTVISTKVNLVQETGKDVQAGFLMYLPVYRYGTLNTTLTERRTNIVGWVYSPFRMGDFMKGILGERAADLDVEIYDGKNILNETKMYSSITQPTGIHQPRVIKKVIEFNEHAWTVLVKYTPKLESRIGYNTAGMILIIGISLSILLSIITWLLINKRMRTILADTERKQMESALKTSEERFRTAAGSLTDVVYDWDINHKLDWYGDIDSITGYEPGGFPRTIEGWESVIHPEDKVRVIEALENHLKNKVPYRVEYRIKRMDGEWRWWSARGTALRDDNGEPYKMIGSITDITEQKDAQNRIKFKSDLLSHIGQAVIATDMQGTVIYWNNVAEEIYGWSSAEAMGQNIVVLTPSEQTEEHAIEIMKALSKGNTWSGEILVKRKDGSIFPAYITDAPFIDSSGKLTGIIGISNDITERKQTAKALSNERSLLRTIIDLIPDAVYAVDTEGRKILANAKEIQLSGKNSEDEIIGKTDFDLYPESDAQRYYEEDQVIIQSGKPNLNIEDIFISKDGQIHWLLGSKVPLRDVHGQITGIVGVNHDITERKLVEEEIKNNHKELIKINAEKDKFFSIIAHDLKSPFNGVLNLTALMSDTNENISVDEFVQYSKMLNKAARNIYMLLDNLLEWSQIQKGSIAFNPKIYDLSKTVSQSIETIYQSALQKRITIINEINDAQRVYADEKSISTVVRNLLTNAVKFTRMDGKIIIKSRRIDDNTIQVSIQDNGVGISDDNVKKLFKIEEKVSTRGTEGEPSSGLGLLLCKEFVEMHGQIIWAESEINKGSTFSFTLREEK